MKINDKVFFALLVMTPLTSFWALGNSYDILWLSMLVAALPLLSIFFIFEKNDDKESKFKDPRDIEFHNDFNKEWN